MAETYKNPSFSPLPPPHIDILEHFLFTCILISTYLHFQCLILNISDDDMMLLAVNSFKSICAVCTVNLSTLRVSDYGTASNFQTVDVWNQ